ncbi:MFS transporter [Streptomyces sp. NPDC048434]|uniref:MFS transporter n=1 Tax=Streptomyces sp. NPDC048434 TaxID=3365549 RepID=UPI00371C486A
MPAMLWLLALGTFTVGTDAYVMAGILPQVAEDLGVSVSAAGQLVTVFALAYALLAPLGASAAARLPGRTVLTGALAVFAFGDVITACAPTYPLALAGRIAAALGASTLTPQAAVHAGRLVPAEQRAKALSVIVGGITLATVCGVPLGTAAGGAFGWRTAPVAVAVLAVCALVGIRVTFPREKAAPRSSTPHVPLALLRHRAVVRVLAISLLTATSEQLVYSYVGPVLEGATGGDPSSLALLLLVFGVGAVAGNALAGHLTDRRDSRMTMLISVSGMTVLFAALPLWSASLPAAAAAMGCWGATGWMYVTPQQHRLLALTGSDTLGSLAVALNSSTLYLGIGLGSLIGGSVLTVAPPAALAWPATALGVTAFVLILLSYGGTKPPSGSAGTLP